MWYAKNGNISTSFHVLYRSYTYTEITEINLFAFAYRMFHEDFSPIYALYLEETAGKTKYFMNTSNCLFKMYVCLIAETCDVINVVQHNSCF